MLDRPEPPPLPVCLRPRRETHIVDTHDDSRGGAAPADLLHGDGVGQVIEASSAELLRHVHGHEPQLAHLLHLAPEKDVMARGGGWRWGQGPASPAPTHLPPGWCPQKLRSCDPNHPPWNPQGWIGKTALLPQAALPPYSALTHLCVYSHNQ